jgi:guanylate kinase
LLDFSGAVRLVTSTTRPPRFGEVPGRDYLFLTRQEFADQIRQRRFLEWQEIYGNLYGSSKEEIDRSLESFAIVVAVMDVRGAKIAREHYLGALIVGVWSERDCLIDRLRRRGTDEAQIAARLAAYDEEMSALAGGLGVTLRNRENRFEDCALSLVGLITRRLTVDFRLRRS